MKNEARDKGEVVKDVVIRVMIWLFLGAAVNFLPILAAYLAQPEGQTSSFISEFGTGDLLIAATAMLAPTLADLATNAKGWQRTRIFITVIGSSVSLVSLLVYGFAQVNLVTPGSLENVSFGLIIYFSVGSFGAATIIGGLCAGFLAISSRSDNVVGTPPPVIPQQKNGSPERDRRKRASRPS